MTEEFRELEEFPGYKFGNMGTIIGKRGKPITQRKCYTSESYYCLMVDIVDKEEKRWSKLAHRIIALAWIPNPDNEPEIDHIDRNPANNCIENLRWSSRLNNANNKGKNKSNTSGITGLFFQKITSRWEVTKSIMGVKHRKTFKERSDAEAYLKELVETPRFIDVDVSTK